MGWNSERRQNFAMYLQAISFAGMLGLGRKAMTYQIDSPLVF